jgi:hypothetical protein
MMMMMILIQAMHGDRMSRPWSLPNTTMNNASALMTREISQHLTRPSSPKNETVCQSGKENGWKL